VERLTERDGGCRAHVLVALLVNKALEFIDITLLLILDNLVVNGTSGALDGGVGAQVEVVLAEAELIERAHIVSCN
jgi:hypothetical protein